MTKRLVEYLDGEPDAGWSDLLPNAWPHAFASRTPAACFATSSSQ
jgi:hypothetical protein